MSAPQKFLFDTCFERDQADSGPNSGARSAPRHTDEDLARSREAGFAEGKQAGEQAARQTIDQLVAKSLEAISQQLGELARTRASLAEEDTRRSVEAAISVVRKLFPHLARQHGLAEIDSLVRDCLERLREEPRIVVRVADALLDEIERRVAAIAAQAGFEGRIVFLAQAGMKPGDIRVEWADGGAERDTEAVWQDIDGLVERIVGLTQTKTAPEAPSAPADARQPLDHSDAGTPDDEAVISA